MALAPLRDYRESGSNSMPDNANSEATMTSSEQTLPRIRQLCANVEALVVLLEGQERNAENVRLMGRLRDSVVRPLRNVLDGMSLEPAAPAAKTAPQALQAPDAILWTLARDATPMVANPSMDYRLGEAIAGLQLLACRGPIG